VPRFELFPHDADVGVRGIGGTREEAFEQAALALTAVVVDPARVEPRFAIEIECSAASDELLLVEWLDALVFELATRGRVFSRIEVHLDGTTLRATVRGEELDAARHEPAVEPKGATMTELRVARDDDGTWLAQCVVDV